MKIAKYEYEFLYRKYSYSKAKETLSFRDIPQKNTTNEERILRRDTMSNPSYMYSPKGTKRC